jgi:methionine-rich copper-binding protein CopC
VPGAWHADVIVRRQNIFDDAQAGFDFTVDPASEMPTFASASAEPLVFGALRLAHAQYASSSPAAGATVPSAPGTLSVTWTQELSAIQFTVTGPLRDAGPGQYLVVWHNVSGEDGDPNDGSFVFSVAGPPAQAAPTAAPASSSAAPTSASTPIASGS